MKNRNIFILIVAILLVISLGASTSALIMSGIREDSTKVSVVLDDSASGRWTSFMAGMEQAAKDNGIKLTIVNTGKNIALNQQYAIMNEEIAAGADGIILQVTSSTGTEGMISDISSKVVLELVDTDAQTDIDVEGRFACIAPDNMEIGRALANEVRIALGSEISQHKVGIIAGNIRQKCIADRLQGFTENMESSGAEVVWTINSTLNIAERIKFKQIDNPCDILVALDDAGLEKTCEYALKEGVTPYIFGEGNSIKNVSYLDDGLIYSMVVPNEYYMGYQALAAVAKRLVNRLTPMENEVISFRVINKENLFDEMNQRLLFPVEQ
jgi:ribose transport system substrate-binding protein